MARIPQVTRTITSTKCTVLCLDIVKGEPFNKDVILPRTYKDEKSMMKKISKIIDNDTEKAVHVVKSEVQNAIYGMTEEKFVELADIIPDRK